MRIKVKSSRELLELGKMCCDGFFFPSVFSLNILTQNLGLNKVEKHNENYNARLTRHPECLTDFEIVFWF